MSTKATQKPYDAIIIGGGHNGLVCAAYLAKAGQAVLVLERRAQVGGGAVTEEVIPGYRVSSIAHAVGLLRPEIIHDLDLVRQGLDIYVADPGLLMLYAPDDGVLFWADPAQTLLRAELSAREQAEYARLQETLGEVAAVLDPTFLMPPLSADELRTRFAAAGLTHRYAQVVHGSIGDFLDEFDLSERTRLTILPLGLTMNYGGPYTPGTAFNLFRLATAQAAGIPGAWGFVRGGMGSLAAALAKAAQAAGVEIRTGVDVEQIVVADGQAGGVIVRGSGAVIRGRTIISNADPKRTFLQLVDPAHLPGDFRQQVAGIQMRGAGMKILCALDGTPTFRAAPAAAAPILAGAGAISIAPSIDHLEQAWQDAQAGRPSLRPMMELTIPSATDSTLAPAGKHVMSIHVQWTPYQLQEGAWSTLGAAYADQVLAQLADYMPNLPEILLARKVLTPLDLEQEYSMTQGHWEHGEVTAGQIYAERPLPGWAGYQTPVAGLYLCGAGTHPGGTISGAPGYNAAQAILTRQF